MTRLAALIPAYNPDGALLTLAGALSAQGVETVVVNDGSAAGLDVFQELGALPGVTVLGYEENRGKGAALKAGFAYLAERGYTGAVTADADGQHTPADILRMMAAMGESPGRLILGSRAVEAMPPKSRAGNRLTRALFRVLYGVRLRDTQTGLRGVPLDKNSLPGLLELPGQRYEYEMEVLRESPRLFPAGIREVPIETVYLNDNSGSHFRPLRDGARIYKVLLDKLPGFILSSVSAFALDYLLFNLLYYWVFPASSWSTPAAALSARAVSGTCNYLVNKRLLFKGGGERYTFLNYWKLALCILAASALLTYLFVDLFHLPAFAVKIVVDLLLFFVNFTVQNAMRR